jgi:hypothetical protein
LRLNFAILVTFKIVIVAEEFVEDMTIQLAFDNFMAAEFERAVDASTKSSWEGEGLSVELFPDGNYLIDRSSTFGKLYISSGLILRIPSLNDEKCKEGLCYYALIAETMKAVVEKASTGIA